VAQYPVITAGSKITADLLNSMMPNYLIKPGDTTRASTITNTNDPDLVVPVVANGVYDIEFNIIFGALQAAGIRTAWATPTGTVGLKRSLGPGSVNVAETNANTTEMRWSVVTATTQLGYTDPRNAVASLSHIIERGLITVGSTAGSVALTWSQNVSSATGTVVSANSYVTWRQVG
jgi:hypothetical protein